MSVSLADQLAAARRELALRRRVYPAWIKSGRLTQERADHEIEAMEAIAATLHKLKLLEEVSEEMRQAWVAEHGPAPEPSPVYRVVAPTQTPAAARKGGNRNPQPQAHQKSLL